MSDISDFAQQQTLLIVDDTPDNITLLSALLKDRYRIKVATNGERALKIAMADPPPDLILLDIMMPKLDGYQVCEALRAKEDTKEIPIIFVTAKTEVKDWTHAIFNVGVNSYITKPINPKKLLDKVKSVLKMKQSREELRKTREKLSKTMGHTE